MLAGPHIRLNLEASDVLINSGDSVCTPIQKWLKCHAQLVNRVRRTYSMTITESYVFLFIIVMTVTVTMMKISGGKKSSHEIDAPLTHLSCVDVQFNLLHCVYSHSSTRQLTHLEGPLSHLEGLSGTCHISPSIHLESVSCGFEELVNTQPVFPTDSSPNSPFLLYSISPLTATEMRYWRFTNDRDSKKSLRTMDLIFLSGHINKKDTSRLDYILITVIKVVSVAIKIARLWNLHATTLV